MRSKTNRFHFVSVLPPKKREKYLLADLAGVLGDGNECLHSAANIEGVMKM